MTVRELIERLKLCPPDLPVVVWTEVETGIGMGVDTTEPVISEQAHRVLISD